MLGIALSLLGALGLAGTVVLSRRGMPGVHPLLTNVVSISVGVPFAAVLALAFSFSDIGKLPLAVLPWIVLLGVVQLSVGRFHRILRRQHDRELRVLPFSSRCKRPSPPFWRSP